LEGTYKILDVSLAFSVLLKFLLCFLITKESENLKREIEMGRRLRLVESRTLTAYFQ